MVPEMMLIALLLGCLLGGRLSRLADVKIKCGWLIFAPVGISIVGAALNYGHVIPGESLVFVAMWVVNLGILAVFAYLNKQIPGALIVMAGLIINILPMVANGSRMPVPYDAMVAISSKAQVAERLHAYPFMKTMLMHSWTRLKPLCDIFVVKPPFVLLSRVYSIGDIISSIGIFIAIIAIMRTPVASENTKSAAEEA